MAQSIALAVLENLVHMSRQDYPSNYVVVAATIPDHVRVIPIDPIQFQMEGARPIGDAWLDHNESAVLKVPSAVVV
jgi:hypothetical protein